MGDEGLLEGAMKMMGGFIEEKLAKFETFNASSEYRRVGVDRSWFDFHGPFGMTRLRSENPPKRELCSRNMDIHLK